MRLVIVCTISWVSLVGIPSLAMACDATMEVSLIAFRQDWSDLVFRQQLTVQNIYGIDEMEILLLRSGRLKKWRTIKALEETSAAVRSQRWKAAEKELMSDGFTIAPKYPAWSEMAGQQWASPDGAMTLETGIGDGKMRISVHEGGKEVATKSFGLPPASPTPWVKVVYSHEKGNTILVLFEVNCSSFAIKLDKNGPTSPPAAER